MHDINGLCRKQKTVMPFTRQYYHLQELKKQGKTPKNGSYSYTAERLFQKGVLVELKDVSEKQYVSTEKNFSSFLKKKIFFFSILSDDLWLPSPSRRTRSVSLRSRANSSVLLWRASSCDWRTSSRSNSTMSR